MTKHAEPRPLDDLDLRRLIAALMALTEAGVPGDVQDMLVNGNDKVRSGALGRAILAVTREVAA